ncbi:TSUP family transporter [Desulfobacula sp.]
MVGIGGILLSPLLTYFLGIDLHLAMAVSSWSFLFTGIVGTITYNRKRTISWYMVCWLSLGIVPV